MKITGKTLENKGGDSVEIFANRDYACATILDDEGSAIFSLFSEYEIDVFSDTLKEMLKAAQ